MLPVRARLSGVIRKVSSNSIHTLPCSDEHKNSPSSRLRENRFQPQHKAERCVLSFGCKTKVSETTIQEAKVQNVAIPTTPLSFQAKAIQPIFSYRRNQCAAIGLDSRRSAGTDRQTAEQSERHTHVVRLRKTVRHWFGCDVGLLGEIYGSTRATYLLLSARAVSVCDRYNAKLCQTDATSCHETSDSKQVRRD